jgi:hypothetical protein
MTSLLNFIKSTNWFKSLYGVTDTQTGRLSHNLIFLPSGRKVVQKEIMIICNFIKIHLKDTDDGALHFCILFIPTLSIVQFNKITTFQRLALSPSSGDKRERAKGR